MSILSIGAIGFRGHAARMIRLSEAHADVSVDRIFHPNRIPDLSGGTSTLSDLLSCDGIMILSPDDTHTWYLRDLLDAGYAGRILCEKPPAVSWDQVRVLEDARESAGGRIVFNFPLRWASQFHDGIFPSSVGHLIDVSCRLTHGLATRESFRGSWRETSQVGILGTVAPHLIDLVIRGAGPIYRTRVSPMIWGRPCEEWDGEFDTATVDVVHQSGTTSHLLVSYAAPAQFTVSSVFTDGLIDFDGEVITVRSPLRTYDDEGRFQVPPVVSSSCIPDPFSEGLQCAVACFLDACRTGSEFPIGDFDRAIQVCEAMLS